MKSLAAAAALVFAGLSMAGGGNDDGRYTDAMYRRALGFNGTAPLYVLVTLRDPRTGDLRTVCTQAPFLLGAIHKEQRLDYSRANMRKAMAIALKQPGRVFAFKREDAYGNASPRYTPEMLAEARRMLGAASDAELTEQVRHPDTPLHEIYGKKDAEQFLAWREAVAHVLLERGILVGHGDIPAALYLWSDREKLLRSWGEIR